MFVTESSIAGKAVVPSVVSSSREGGSVLGESTVHGTTASSDYSTSSMANGSQDANGDGQESYPEENDGNRLGRTEERPIGLSDSESTDADGHCVEEKENLHRPRPICEDAVNWGQRLGMSAVARRHHQVVGIFKCSIQTLDPPRSRPAQRTEDATGSGDSGEPHEHGGSPAHPSSAMRPEPTLA
ncbi:MAG: hypothetical protein M1823_001260 [Watsoniomyces obsoletus]|nr:MAG: hypothetical protein M1823_001260 [Watsoniomyces obsoletus]